MLQEATCTRHEAEHAVVRHDCSVRACCNAAGTAWAICLLRIPASKKCCAVGQPRHASGRNTHWYGKGCQLYHISMQRDFWSLAGHSFGI